jgi:peroxiredoxin
MSFPVYAQLYVHFAPQGLIVLAVSADENQAAYNAFVKKEAPPFATVRDKTHKLVSQVKVPAMPTCYLLGRDGRVRFVHQGFHGAETEQELRQEIESLLAEPPPQL